MQMQEKGEEKKWLNHFEHFSFQTLVLEEDHFLGLNLCLGGEGEELKPFKFERNIRALKRFPRGPKDGGIWPWPPDDNTLLLW